MRSAGVSIDGNELVVWDPQAPGEIELERLVFPRQPRHDRICLADFFRPLTSGTPDVVAIQAVTAGDEVTELLGSVGLQRPVLNLMDDSTWPKV